MKKKILITSLVLLLFSTFVLAGCEPLVAPRAVCFCDDSEFFEPFICLQGAVERRWVRRRDIRNIAYIRHDGEVRDGQGRVLDFTPTVDTNPVICEDLHEKLKNAWGSHFDARHYYGTFGRNVVINLSVTITHGSYRKIIANTYFWGMDPLRLMIWRMPL